MEAINRRKPSTVEVQLDKVRSLGKTLPEAYDMILQQVPDWNTAKKLLKWLVVARRPLTTAEANEIVGLERTCTSVAMLRGDLPTNPATENLKRHCGLLIHIVEANQTIQIVHHSVRDFFLAETTASQWRFTQHEAELE
jgi:hypothetical protein